MAVTAAGFGTQTATINTEHTVHSVTTAGTFTYHVDLNAMAAGDTVELRINQKILTAGTLRATYYAVFSNACPLDNIVQISVPISNELTGTTALTFTLKQTTGTGRAFPWKVLSY
jgi:hypothetical protein